MARRSKAEASWRLLLEACHKVGRLKVIEMLEKEHKTYENWAAWAWGDPASHSLARQLDRKCLTQDETLICLRSMTDEDVTQLVAGKGTPPSKPTNRVELKRDLRALQERYSAIKDSEEPQDKEEAARLLRLHENVRMQLVDVGEGDR